LISNEGLINEKINESSNVIRNLDYNQIDKIADVIINAFKNGNIIYFFGNGGSASDAEHLAAELCGKYLLDRDPLPAISLSTHISAITAIANDYSFDDVFYRQLKAYAKSDDVAIGISTSGSSKNVLKAINFAKENNIISIGFSGLKGELKDIVDYALIIPSDNTPRIQEGYMVSGHIICNLVERGIFEEKSSFHR
jgi:D-sedoheptulose 7-phosphate isomerase